MAETTVFNAHNKEEYPPAHSAEHLLNGTMERIFHCGRAFSAHVERKKSKLDFHLPQPLTEEQIRDIEERINTVIQEDLPIWTETATQSEVSSRFNMERLPEDASETVRIVHIGDYDECLCIGRHVEHTSQIGHFHITSSRWEDGIQRIVFKLE